MSRYFKKIAFIALFLCVTSPFAENCQDILQQCPQLKGLCFSPQAQQYCPKTCGVCTPDSSLLAPDLCRQNNGGCEQLCDWISTEKDVNCSCLSGFKLAEDRRACLDVDECNEGPNPCFFESSHCVNTVGSYSCEPNSCDSPGTMNYYRNGACCQVKNSSCGLTSSIRRYLSDGNTRRYRTAATHRIFGGQASVAQAWPWMAQILFRGVSHCGATLITNKWMLSAGHCFSEKYFTLDGMEVYLGRIRSAHVNFEESSNGVQRRIVQVILHSNHSGYDNDIALVELNEPVPINDYISPICLPCGEKPDVGDKCWSTGFGRTETSGRNTAYTLREVDVPIVSFNACRTAYKDVQEIDINMMLCAGYEEGEKDACIGDSGGPLACQRNDSCEWYVSGVTSFGRDCGRPGYYGVYANVVNYENWIRQSLGEEAINLCQKITNPCDRISNVDSDCYSKLDRCSTYPLYMEANCGLACCQLEHKEIENCFDDPESASTCESYVQQCGNPVYESFMKEKCKKTCQFC